jgi:hypothetical protein
LTPALLVLGAAVLVNGPRAGAQDLTYADLVAKVGTGGSSSSSSSGATPSPPPEAAVSPPPVAGTTSSSRATTSPPPDAAVTPPPAGGGPMPPSSPTQAGPASGPPLPQAGSAGPALGAPAVAAGPAVSAVAAAGPAAALPQQPPAPTAGYADPLAGALPADALLRLDGVGQTTALQIPGGIGAGEARDPVVEAAPAVDPRAAALQKVQAAAQAQLGITSPASASGSTALASQPDSTPPVNMRVSLPFLA